MRYVNAYEGKISDHVSSAAADSKATALTPQKKDNGESANINPTYKGKQKRERPPIQLEWKDIKFEVTHRAPVPKDAKFKDKLNNFFRKQKKIILHPMSGHVSPGECLAIMGPSGAGKTSLLNILAQRVKASEGEITVNGQNVEKSFRGLSAFVQQDDVLMGNLTVREVMRYAALLRLDLPLKEKMARIDQILDELGLTKCADTVVGIPGFKKGISGGERKRLSIAIELLTEPSVLFLDEPTTGLDAKTALNVMDTIIKIARNGRAVVLTIHQPRSDIYRRFDKLLLLARGKVAYFGPANKAVEYFSSLPPITPEQPDIFKCPDEYNPADYLIDLITETTSATFLGTEQKIEDNRRIEYILNEYEKNFTYVKPYLDAKLDINLGNFSTYRTNWITQFFVLLVRSFLNVMRDRMLTISRAIQSIVMALVVGLIYLKMPFDQNSVINRRGVLFFMMLNTNMGTLFTSLIVFLSEEKGVFLRERASKTYRVSSYYLSKSIAEFPNVIIFTCLFGAISYWMCNLNPAVDRFFMFLFIMIVSNLASQSLGMLLACIAPTSDVALALAPILTTILMLFAGLYLNISSIPNYLIWIYYISMFHYAYEALILNEFQGVTFSCPEEPQICAYPTGDAFIQDMAMTGKMATIWINIAMLFALILVMRILTYIVLRFAQKPKGS